MSIGSVTAAGSPFMVGATRPRRSAENDEVCECNGHTYFKKDEEFFAQAYGRKLRWPITGSKGLMPTAEALTHASHELAYKAGQSFDTGKFIQNSSRWYPDVFSGDLVNRAASYFGRCVTQDGRNTLWA